MLKIETKILPERGIVALGIEASGLSDLPSLDLIAEALSGQYKTECGFSNSTRLVVHVSGMPQSVFDPVIENLTK
jgi:hypothetical protein